VAIINLPVKRLKGLKRAKGKGGEGEKRRLCEM